MGAARELVDKKVLKNLVPLNSLSQIHFKEVTKNAVIEDVAKGSFLFQQGKRDSYTFYVLSGEVSIINGKTIVGSVSGGSKQSKQPLPNEQPRKYSARAKTKATVMRVDTSLLDVLLDWDQSGHYEVTEIQSDDDDDWMTKMLKSELFAHIPAQNIQKMIMRMEEVRCKAGESIIHQHEKGDCYYIMKSGHCVVSRQTAKDSKPVLIAELRDGDSFGEEALISDGLRNASVTMITDGTLMRLSKSDFQELLQDILVTKVNMAEAIALANEGATWLDVQMPAEHKKHALPGSVNIPLNALRSSKEQLDINDVYVVYCLEGLESASAVFVLGQYGFDAVLLDGGIQSIPASEIKKLQASVKSADVINIKPESVPVAPAPRRASKIAKQEEKKAAKVAVKETKLKEKEFAKNIKEQARKGKSAEESLLEKKANQTQINSLREQLDKAKSHIEIQEKDIATIALEKEKLASRLKDFTNKAVSKREEMNDDVDDLHKQLEDMQYEHDVERKNLEKEVSVLNKNVEKAESYRTETKSLKEEVKELERIQKQSESELEIIRDEAGDKKTIGTELAKLRSEHEHLLSKNSDNETEKSNVAKELSEIKSLQKSEDKSLGHEMDALREEVKRLSEEYKIAKDSAKQYLAEKEQIERNKEEDEQVRVSLLEQQSNSSQESKQKVSELEKEMTGLREELESNRGLIDQLAKSAQATEDKSEADKEKQEFLETLQKHQSKIQTLEQSNNELHELLKSSEVNTEKLKEQKAKIEFDWQAAEKARTGLIEQYDLEINKLEDTKVRNESQLDIERRNAKELQEKLKSTLENRDKQIEKINTEAKMFKQERDLLKKDLTSSKASASNSSKSEGKLQNENAKLEKAVENRDIKIKETSELLKALEQEKNIIEEAKLDIQKQKKGSDKEWSEKLEKKTSDYHAIKYRNEQFETELNILKTDFEQNRKRLSEYEIERDELYEQLKGAEQRGIEQSSVDKEAKTLMREIKALEKDNKKSQNTSKTRIAELDTTVTSLQTEIKKYRDLQSILEDKNHELEEDVIGINSLNSKLADKDKEVHTLQRQVAQTQAQLNAAKESIRENSEKSESDVEYLELQQEHIVLKEELDEIQIRNQQLERERSVYESEISGLKKSDKAHSQDSSKLKEIRKQKSLDDKELDNLKSDLAIALSANAEIEEKLRQNQATLRDKDSKMQLLGEELKGSHKAAGKAAAMKDQLEGIKRDAKDKVRQYQYEYESMVKAIREENQKLRTELQRVQHVAKAQANQQAKALQAAQSAAESSNVMKLDLPPDPNDPYTPLDIADIPQAPDPSDQRFDVPEIAQYSDFAQSGQFQSNQIKNNEFQSSEYSQYTSDTFGERTQVHFVSEKEAGKSFSFAKLSATLLIVALFGGAAYWYFDIYPRAKREAARIEAQTKTIVPKVKKPKLVKVEKPLKAKAVTKPALKKKPAKPAVERAVVVRPGKTFQDKLADETLGPKMVEIPKARFAMGSKNSALEASEKPRHAVSLKRYSISKYEVTFAQYLVFANATDRRIPEDEWGKTNRPVINVSWQDAVDYTRWLSEQTGYIYRLPSEAEWEYAARAGSVTDYHWGNSLGSNRSNCFDCGSQWDSSKTAPIGSFKANKFGLHDMLGNVMEWTLDCYHNNYKGAPKNGSAWLTGSCKTRVLRGGSYIDTDDQIRSFARVQASKTTVNKQIGFRVVREL